MSSTPEQNAKWRQRRTGIKCVIDGCVRGSTAARGMCPAHYRRWYEGLPVNVVLPVRSKNVGPCSIDGCDKPSHTRGWCRTHYARYYRNGEPGCAKPRRRAAGQGSIGESSRGYHILFKDGRRRAAHLLAMEELLGRPLNPGETVHHVNGQRADNRTNGPLDERYRSGNLELWSSAQPAGQRVADKIDFAVELLRQYAPHLLQEDLMPLSNASNNPRRPGPNPERSTSTADGLDPSAPADMSGACEAAESAAVSHAKAEGRKAGLS